MPMAGRARIADLLVDLRENYTPALARFAFARALAAHETAIGIRPDQQEAWRAYTNAVLAMIPSKGSVEHLLGKANENPVGPPAFGRMESVADNLLERHAKAQALKKAIVELRSKLTPDQLEAARFPRLLTRR